MQVAAILAAVEEAMVVASALLDAGKSIAPIAKELFETLGKDPEDVTDADLDRLAAATDLAHSEVQEIIGDDPA